MPKYAREFLEQSIGSDERLTINRSENIVAVEVKNQGTATVKTAWNSETGINQILPGASQNFDGGDSGILQGFIKIQFVTAGTQNVIITKLKQVEEICD